ncbi:hypothetical protein AGMMS49546_19190 [Spirochaetia bacterium]|nr:hypothetical protein AGMMS49546_19190 [Spirochaetia bacterium]
MILQDPIPEADIPTYHGLQNAGKDVLIAIRGNIMINYGSNLLVLPPKPETGSRRLNALV